MKRWLCVGTCAALVAASAPVRALEGGRFEITPIVGAWIPLGDARRDLRTAPLSGVQLAAELDPHLALVGEFAWVPTEAKVLGSAGVDMFQYDLGARLQQPFMLRGGATLRPFIGAGGGFRTLRFDGGRHSGGTDQGVYASAGLTASYGALAAGVTARWDYARTDVPSLDSWYHALELYASAGIRF